MEGEMKEGTIHEAIREHTRKIAEQIVDEWDETRIASHRGYATTVVSEFLQWAFHNHKVDIYKEQSGEVDVINEATIAKIESIINENTFIRGKPGHEKAYLHPRGLEKICALIWQLLNQKK